MAHRILRIDHRLGNANHDCLLVGRLPMVRALRGTVSAFNHAKRVSLVALALSLTMWLVVFLSVGGEWFLMWQSKSWNGQEEAFRMFTVVGIVLLVVSQPEIADQA